MSRTITPPIARIPVGLVNINGQQVEVRQHPEFVRFFFDLFTRVGGVEAPPNADDLMIDLGAPDPNAVRAESMARAALDALDALPAIQPHQAPDADPDPSIQSLRAELDELRQIVTGLQQGYQV